MRDWRLLLPGTCAPPVCAERAGEAAWNMALDEELFESVCAGGAPILRLYVWERPAVTLGRFQNIARTVHPAEAERQNVPLVRRITGGRGILHGSDVTICLTASLADLHLPVTASVSSVYDKIAIGYMAAINSIGVHAQMGECSRQVRRDRQGDCFQTVSRADVIEAGTNRKLLGAALHRRENWILQQASLPFRSPQVAVPLFQGERFLHEEKAGPTSEALCTAIYDAFQSVLPFRLQASELLDSEQRGAQRRMITRYLSTEWTRGRLSPDTGVEIDS